MRDSVSAAAMPLPRGASPARGLAFLAVVAALAVGVLWRMPAGVAANGSSGQAQIRRSTKGHPVRAQTKPGRATATTPGQPLRLPATSSVSVAISAGAGQGAEEAGLAREISARGYRVLKGNVNASGLSPGVYFAPGYSIEAGILTRALGLPPQDSQPLPQPSEYSPDVTVVVGGSVVPGGSAGG